MYEIIKKKEVIRGFELKKIDLTNIIFEKLVNSNLLEIDYVYLSSNENLTEDQIKYLFTLKIDNVNINLLRNSNCPSSELDNFIELQDKIYNIAIAHNKNLSKQQINKLLDINDDDVNMSLKFVNAI